MFSFYADDREVFEDFAVSTGNAVVTLTWNSNNSLFFFYESVEIKLYFVIDAFRSL